MKKNQLFLCIILVSLQSLFTVAQDSLITKVAQNNHTLFAVENNTFKGVGWETIVKKAQESNFVLIGEDHFLNELPFFCNAITSKIKFDNFFCETDPYSATILQSKIKTLTDEQLTNYIAEYGNTFSFFALASEFDLFKKMVKSGATIYGTDQIIMNADRLVCSELKIKTKNKEAKLIYQKIEENSKTYFLNFLKDQSNPMYMLTDDYDKNLTKLSQLKLSEYENEIIGKLKLTTKIYKEQNHHLRIQLMKNQMMENYNDWKNKKSIFKFGANHVPKGESFLKIYDIGNLVDNIADSNYSSSLHLLVVGKSGTQGSPFKGFPESIVDEKSDNLNALKPFFNCVVDPNKWYCFDMVPLRKKIEAGEITTTDSQLLRIIKGYDFVIIIPKVTASKFPD